MSAKTLILSFNALLIVLYPLYSIAESDVPIKATTTAPVAVVEKFVQAFNDHSVERLLSYTTDSVHWFNLSGTKMLTETSSKNELGAAMADYFATLADAKATLTQVVSSANYVSTVERVTWSDEGELNSQCSIGVYELQQEKINAVWYYPAHVCEPSVDNGASVQAELLQDTRQ
ncbi:nuclear transport factor 2 family protein [Shewanella sp. KX20019]|uniref:nuclear transport factor 2 family protein n=1 Tax=Shewanella sp. KX20019 TaxID=2803864 RepID=UPI001928F0BE|nr:nuclear transport factor 2 family protein [Shewanella sp. KX20019]QQX79971.1 nuclear transport factor 2 family protein [Shewanella sp. KX20019]